MSFQHFRLHSIPPPQGPTQPSVTVTPLSHAVSPSSLSQALGQTQQNGTHPQQVLPDVVPNQTAPGTPLTRVQSGGKKGPYGSGDVDDGYTLVFESMAAFQAWRQKEEEEKMVEFVKGDTHGSKAVPPRFKDHTKLVCARHTRSGRKKYVKKYPDRVRKVPSRKLEGVGCQASISYKTYYDTEEVRACYVSEHSHEVGIANLPYTRRGRKAAAEAGGRRTRSRTAMDTASPPPESQSPIAPPASTSSTQTINAPPPPAGAGPSTMPIQPPIGPQPTAPNALGNHAPPALPPFQPALMGIVTPVQPAPPPDITQDRWDRMSVLFQAIRDNARTYEFPAPSVAALESVLVRLYLESPMGGGAMNVG